ncbi:NAD(P)/FAD-dependent oxidoreductase [Mycolicibacterium sp.]|uniref:NAD(P)/FAD-dependent oxidoreductase n=1 Tax=Mycolicibacterium sp. TaxID=2320850 RepID=UPI003D0D3F47
MTGPDRVVIIGAGHGGFAVADGLRQRGYPGAITLIDAQPGLPYQRPPLSKDFLGGADIPVEFRTEQFYARTGIDHRDGEGAVSIDRARRTVTTASGDSVGYRHLVLATGAQAQAVPAPGAGLAGVCRLHVRADAEQLRARFASATRAVVIGGGFIGLEVAAAARARGIDVTVVEAAPRLMSRSVSTPVSEVVLRSHRAAGTAVRLGARVVRVHGDGGAVRAVELDCGDVLPADVVVTGVGVRPRTALARAAGLDLDNGIVVDEYLRTADPAISAIGDCAAFPDPVTGRTIRLESVQNATDQARCVAARLTGDPQPYRDTPWFWSHQGPVKLQIAGLQPDAAEHLVHGDPAGRFSVLHLDDDGRVRCGESVNSPADHAALRILVAAGERIGPALREDPAVPLKTLARPLTALHR